MARVDWRKLSEQDFNDMVEALLVREFTGDGLIAQALDGRGGDGGIDVDVRSKKTDQVVRVYQLKYFPEGFSGGFLPRRKQIKKSFKTALKEVKMPAWVLVTPRKATSHERKAVRGMRDGVQVTLTFMGPPELDALLSKHPDIERRFTIDREVEILNAVGRESAALAKPSDLNAEVGHLKAKLDGRSEYWGTAFSVGADGTTHEALYAKRADAQEREPLRLTANLAFGEGDEDVRRDFESAMRFGALDTVELPSHVVESFVREGPGWFEGTDRNPELRVSSATIRNEDRPVRVIAQTGTDGSESSLNGKTVAFAFGTEGATMRAALQGGVEITWRLPSSADAPGRVNVESTFSGQSAHRLLRVVRFLDQLSSATRLGIEFDTQEVGWIDLPEGHRPAYSAQNPRFVAFLNDLHYLEARADVEFDLPERGPVDADLIDARMTRLLLEGYACAERQDLVFNGTLDSDLPDSVRDLIREGGAIAMHGLPTVQNLLGARVPMGLATYYTQSAEVINRDELLAALDDGDTEGLPIALRPTDGMPWTVYIPNLLNARGEEKVQARPWGIEGMPEHAGYERLPHALNERVDF